MEIDFLLKNIKFTFWFTIIGSGILLVLRQFSFGFGLLVGSFWNLVNFWLIIFLTRTLSPGEGVVNRKKIILLLGLKIPVLYGLGYLILRFSNLSLSGILVGFSLLFFVMVVRAAGYFLNQGQTVTSGGRK